MENNTDNWFFQAHKRNEIIELQKDLDNIPPDDCPYNREKRKEVFKKVISYMALGVDLSGLLSKIIIANVTTDIIQKKLVGIYLNNYAAFDPDICILVINTYIKDCSNSDARIRGLALKSLANIMNPTTSEYAEKAAINAFSDNSTYVKKMACLAVLKMNEPSKFKVYLEDILVDKNVKISLKIICILILNDIDHLYRIDKNLIVKLFNYRKSCNFFEKIVCLYSISTYKPSNADELFKIVNELETHLFCLNLSVFITTCYCILSLIRNYYESCEDNQQYYILIKTALNRMKNGVLSLMKFTKTEHLFSVLEFLFKLILFYKKLKFNECFNDNLDDLIPVYVEPIYIINLKLKILMEVVTEDNTVYLLDSLKTKMVVQFQNSFIIQQWLQLNIKIYKLFPQHRKRVLDDIFELIEMGIDSFLTNCFSSLLKIFSLNATLVREYLKKLKLKSDQLKKLNLRSLNDLLLMISIFPQENLYLYYDLLDLLDEDKILEFITSDNDNQGAYFFLLKHVITYPDCVEKFNLLKLIHEKIELCSPENVENFIFQIRLMDLPSISDLVLKDFFNYFDNVSLTISDNEEIDIMRFVNIYSLNYKLTHKAFGGVWRDCDLKNLTKKQNLNFFEKLQSGDQKIYKTMI